ncbi:MAG: NFACT family protein [Deltaproteobacteria bacterium]|nr:NFACT family protein [Deltaproteobacteria bacterium]
MDLFFIHGIVKELKEEIVGGFITKIYQMNRTDLLLRIRRLGEEKQLLLSTHPAFYRLHLTEKKYANPMVPPRFCTYLRKPTLGAMIADVSQDPYERVVRISLSKKMDAGVRRDLTLVAELAGKGSNVLLLEGEKILDCFHFRKVEDGAGRPQVPGVPYTPPPVTNRWCLNQVTPERMEEIIAGSDGELNMRERARLAREMEFLAEGNAPEYGEVFRSFFERYEGFAFEPRILSSLDGKKIPCPFPVKSLADLPEEVFPSMNQAADAYYFATVMERQITEQKQVLSRRLKQLRSRLQKRRENLIADQEKFQKDLECRVYGELLVANYPRLKKGLKEVEVQDFRQDPPGSMVVPLDGALDPAGNVERYFKKYKKAKRGLEFAAERSARTDREITYLESTIFEVEEAEDGEELAGIRKELEEGKILAASARAKVGKEKKEPSLPVRRLRSSQGLEIYCGKNNLGNDFLLRRLAKGNDLWFHAQGFPGSHVLLKVGKEDPPYNAILEAAMVAAYFSRGRGSTRLPVDYTAAKNVHRPKGARPGLVTITQQKTVFVAPDKEKVEKLLLP